ncbi:hypothetical protein ACJX0J_030187, partial [Zea mays]
FSLPISQQFLFVNAANAVGSDKMDAKMLGEASGSVHTLPGATCGNIQQEKYKETNGRLIAENTISEQNQGSMEPKSLENRTSIITTIEEKTGSVGMTGQSFNEAGITAPALNISDPVGENVHADRLQYIYHSAYNDNTFGYMAIHRSASFLVASISRRDRWAGDWHGWIFTGKKIP